MPATPLTFPISLPSYVNQDSLGTSIRFQDEFYLAMPFRSYHTFSATPGEDFFRVAFPSAGISADEKLKFFAPETPGSTEFITFGRALQGLPLNLCSYGNPGQTNVSAPGSSLGFYFGNIKDAPKWKIYSLEHPDDDRPLCYGDLIVVESVQQHKLLGAGDNGSQVTPRAAAAAAGLDEIWIILKP